MAQKVAGKSYVRSWASPTDDWETLSVNAAVNVFFSNKGRLRQQKEQNGLCLSSAVLNI